MADKQTSKAKVSKREQYLKKIQPYNQAIDRLLKKEEATLEAIEKDPEHGALKRVALAETMLNLASNYLVLNGVSQSILKTKNEDALNEGRKAVYKSVAYLEDTVSNFVDAAFSEYAEKLAAIETLDAARRYDLVRKMGLTILLLEDAYGSNTRWKWSFVELEGRYAVVARNLLDLKKVAANWDPRSPDYRPMMYHFRLSKKLLMQAADRYREKYELVTHNLDDFKTGILFLSALQRFLAQMSERGELETVRKKYNIWIAKLETDIKTRIDFAVPKNISTTSP
ncbi:MAG: hypothetical protein LBT87_07065 [Treponema sp.]|jgi:hypothetical protein|nr:hypothetical protein [Treponema sp.]